VTNADQGKGELFYRAVWPASQVVLDFELRGAAALADLPCVTSVS